MSRSRYTWSLSFFFPPPTSCATCYKILSHSPRPIPNWRASASEELGLTARRWTTEFLIATKLGSSCSFCWRRYSTVAVFPTFTARSRSDDRWSEFESSSTKASFLEWLGGSFSIDFGEMSLSTNFGDNLCFFLKIWKSMFWRPSILYVSSYSSSSSTSTIRDIFGI